MGTLCEKKLIEMLMEIQSDIRQIKYDVQLLLKQQPQTAPAHSPNSEDTAEFIETSGSTSSEDVLRYLREKRGEDDSGTD
jgi:hypothetical protein